MSSTSIQTYTGKYFDYADFNQNDIDEDDVAMALANNCRYNGHCIVFYSVAKHLCLVHDLMSAKKKEMNLTSENIFHGLIHDVGEAYLTDIPRPLKNYFLEMDSITKKFMDRYIKLEKKIVDGFALKFGYGEHNEEQEKIVKFFDNWALRLEQRHIMKKTTERWDNESIQFPEDSQAVKQLLDQYFYGNGEENWANEFLNRLGHMDNRYD